MNKQEHSTTILSLPTALFLIFLTLKLLDKIDWSWWWVTCPLWAVPSLFLAFAVGCLAIGGLVVLFRRK